MTTVAGAKRPRKTKDPKYNLVGQRFGRLLVLAPVRIGKDWRWDCHCECGGTAVVRGCYLKKGKTKSCGCWNREAFVRRVTTHGFTVRTVPRRPEYTAWGHMISRCTNPTTKQYEDYGGRGITVCDRWRSFENFLADMGPRPSSRHSIDRVNNERGYEPGNCRWATKKEQQRNRRQTIIVIVDGQRLSLSDLADRTGVTWATLYGRWKRGLPVERLIAPPRHVRHGAVPRSG